MTEWLRIILAAVAGYLLGSIPIGIIVSKITGVDIRKLGSGNIGATNVFRTVGKGYGVIVFLGDAAKGFLASSLGYYLLNENGMMTAGLASILGHNYSIFLKGSGGKGIATSFGVILRMMPLTIMILLACWAIIVFLTGYVSLGSIIAAALFPVFTWFIYRNIYLLTFALILASLAIWRHKSNIRKLLSGEENCFRKKVRKG